MSDQNFIKVKENFICEHCDAEIIGTGYTNHCPQCLWSKHVDINPGDRAESCGGMMEPIKIESKSDGFDIIHQCQKCETEKRNKINENDSKEAILILVEQFLRV
jgi:hypothetical protein